jgi:hypothetical protein
LLEVVVWGYKQRFVYSQIALYYYFKLCVGNVNKTL